MSSQHIILNQSVVRQLMELGYTKEQIVLAIQATNLSADCQNLSQYLTFAKLKYNELYEFVHQHNITNQFQNNLQQQQRKIQNSIKKKIRNQYIPVGLVNIGNICYFNSLLQWMSNNPIFIKTIFNYKVQYCNNKYDNFLNSLQKLFANLLISNQNYYDASEVLQFMCWDQQDIRLIGYQQDFIELCEIFLHKVDQSLKETEYQQQSQIQSTQIFNNQILRQQFEIKYENTKQQFFITAILQYNNIYNILYNEFQQQKLISIPDNLVFQIQRYSYNKNTQNMMKSTQDFNLYQQIYIDFILKDINQIHNLFHQFNGNMNQHQQIQLDPQKVQKQIETFQEIIQYYQRNQNEIMVQQLQQDLNQLIEQSQYQNSSGDCEWLNYQLSQFCFKKYYLHTIVIHYGSVNQGHYFIYIYNFSRQQWFQYNDSVVEQISESEVMRISKNNAYIVTYVSEQQRQQIKQQEDIIEIIQQNNLSSELYENFELLQMIPQNLFLEIYQQNLNVII